MERLMTSGNTIKRGRACGKLSAKITFRFSRDSKNSTHTARQAVRKQLESCSERTNTVFTHDKEEDYMEAVKVIKKLRQKDEQESNHPTFPSRQTRKDCFKKGNGNGTRGPPHPRRHGQDRILVASSKLEDFQ